MFVWNVTLLWSSSGAVEFMGWKTGGVTSQSPAVSRIPVTSWSTTTGRRSFPFYIFCLNLGKKVRIFLTQTNKPLILFCPLGLSGEIDGLVFVELQVHWRWRGNNVYHTGRVHFTISILHIYWHIHIETTFWFIFWPHHFLTQQQIRCCHYWVLC